MSGLKQWIVPGGAHFINVAPGNRLFRDLHTFYAVANEHSTAIVVCVSIIKQLAYPVRQAGVCPGWEQSAANQQGDVGTELESSDGRAFAAALTMYQTQQPNRGPSATLANGIADPDEVLVVPEARFGGWPLTCSPYYTQPESWQPRFYVFNPSETITATLQMYLLGENSQPSELRVPSADSVAPRKRLNVDLSTALSGSQVS